MRDQIDEGDLIELAASGYVGAQVWMAELCQAHHVLGNASLAETLAGAEVFARLAAANNVFAGVETVEQLRDAIHMRATANVALASVLLLQVDRLAGTERHRADDYAAQANALLDHATESGPEGRIEVAALLAKRADTGDDCAAIWLNKLLATVSRKEAARLKVEAKRHLKAKAEIDAEVSALAAGLVADAAANS